MCLRWQILCHEKHVIIICLESKQVIDVALSLQKVTVKKGHATYEQLENPSIPIYKDFYFFNLTNYVEFAESSGGAIPILEEKGPYSYR